MQVLKIDRNHEDFYDCLGPIFGSRIIEQDTKDRFYDDAGKIWYFISGQGVASVLGDTIKNFWAASPEAALYLLGTLIQEYEWLDGIVPKRHEASFVEMGFSCQVYKKNFLEVHYRAKY